MNAAERTPPRATSQIVARWIFFGSRSQPNSQRPRNVDSRKNAASPSIASRRAEHVADVSRVARPVHPELELLHEPGHHADRDVDHQQRAEELREALVLGVTASIPHRLEDRDEEPQPDCDRDEQEVVDARRRELDARQVDVHATPLIWGTALWTTRPWSSTTISSTDSSAASRWVIRSVVRPAVAASRSRVSARPQSPRRGARRARRG